MESWSLLTSRKLFFVGQHGKRYKRYKQCGSLPSYFSLWSIILTAFDVHCCIGREDLPRNAMQRSSRCDQLQLPRHSALQRHPDPWWRLSAMETVMNSRFHISPAERLHWSSWISSWNWWDSAFVDHVRQSVRFCHTLCYRGARHNSAAQQLQKWPLALSQALEDFGSRKLQLKTRAQSLKWP